MKDEKRLKVVFTATGVIMWIAIVLIIVFCLCKIIDLMDAHEYNNGLCRKCGGNYEHVDTVGSQFGAIYIYACDKCGDRIELTSFVVD